MQRKEDHSSMGYSTRPVVSWSEHVRSGTAVTVETLSCDSIEPLRITFQCTQASESQAATSKEPGVRSVYGLSRTGITGYQLSASIVCLPPLSTQGMIRLIGTARHWTTSRGTQTSITSRSSESTKSSLLRWRSKRLSFLGAERGLVEALKIRVGQALIP